MKNPDPAYQFVSLFADEPSGEDDVLASFDEARRLVVDLCASGWDAHLETSLHPHVETRVWIQHPTQPDTCAYVTREEALRLVAGGAVPHWIAK